MPFFSDTLREVESVMIQSHRRYGDFNSTHEALGVAYEEWDELRQAISLNDLKGVERECLDLAAVVLRLARLMHDSKYQHSRSTKK